MKKIIVLVLCIAGLGFIGFRIFEYIQEQNAQTVEIKKPVHHVAAPKPLRVLDVDALASRMKKHQDLYKQLRDDSLKVYAKLHPNPSQYDKPAQTAIRLAAYLWVWDDYYKEGLWKTYNDYACQSTPIHPTATTPEDSLINVFSDIWCYSARNRHPGNAKAVESLKKCVNNLEKSDYPAHFKYAGYANMVHCLSHIKMCEKKMDGVTKTNALIPEMVDKTGYWYGELIRIQIPDDILYAKGYSLLDDNQDEEETLTTLWAALDKKFLNYAPRGAARCALVGGYYTIYAWTARGSGWSNTVTDEGWRLMKERLIKAGNLLETAYPDSTLKTIIARKMITVVLGLQQGKELMETWYRRGIENDPNDYNIYAAKFNFLLPRWYGSPQELLTFGSECIKTENWAAKVPMIFISAISDLAEDNTKIYSMPQVWDPLEKVFREYLNHYPESTIYRSQFAKCAAQGGHWKIAKEQFDILGDEWDRETFSEIEYKSFLESANRQAKTN